MAFTIISITFKQKKNLLTGKGFLTVPFTNHIPEISVPPQHTRRQSSSCTVAALPQAVMHAQDHNEDIRWKIQSCALWISLPLDQQALLQAIYQFLKGILYLHGPCTWSLQRSETSLCQSQAHQHITLCWHCGQYCMSRLRRSHGRRSHWLRCPFQCVRILKIFLRITRNAKERANTLNASSLETRCYSLNPIELDRNRGIVTPFCHRNRACFPRTRGELLLWTPFKEFTL